jgi:hypothetical protein
LKINKTTTLFLIGGILLIAGVSLGMVRSQQTEQLQLMQKRLAQTKQKLALVKTEDLAAQKNNLILEIENYSSQIDSSKQKLATSEDSITACDVILETAKSYGVDILGMSSNGETSGNLAGNQCTVMSITLHVEGNIQSISDFVCNIGQKFPTSVIKEVQLSKKELPPTPTPLPDSSPTPTPTPPPTPDPVEATPLPPGFKPVVNPAKNATASIEIIIYNYEGN